MDTAKVSYFLSKYRLLGNDELADASARTDLADEAVAALKEVVRERKLEVPDIQDEATRGAKEPSEAERSEQAKLSTDLWNGSLSKRVQFQFGALTIVFSLSLLGSQGLRVGALWLLLSAGVLYYFASRIGRQYTRSVCSNGDKTIDEKRSALRTTSLWLWPAMLIPAFLGVLLASAIRGA